MPTKYGSKTYTWEGKFLTEVADEDGSKTQFEYDANGFRTQKRQYGADGRLEYYVEYLWLDGKLTQQALTLMAYRSDGTSYGIGPVSAKFVYEENSQQPQSCLIGDTVLLFVRNLQGDVVAVVNGDGSIWAEFTYDAWGNVEVTSPLEDESIREAALKMLPLLCPLTYRGYNYDFTTGLYYLQSRYYNPEWGRFLNCDDTSILLATQGTTHGANLFAYCENNPVNSVDYTGQNPQPEFWVELIMLLVVLSCIDMACGDRIYDVFPCFTYFNTNSMTVEKDLYFLSFTYNIQMNQRVIMLLVKAALQTELGVMYFEGNFEIRTRADWEYISYGGSLGDSLTRFDDSFEGISYGLSEVLPYPYLECFTAFEFARTIMTEKTVNSKRGRYIRSELNRQQEMDPDAACILNWYCRYQKKKFFGKVINVNYIEHDCAKEFRG